MNGPTLCVTLKISLDYTHRRKLSLSLSLSAVNNDLVDFSSRKLIMCEESTL